MRISVVIPLYRCAECLPELYRRLRETFQGMGVAYEIVMVNDGSPANDWEIVAGLAAQDPGVVGLNFARNFGQHVAISAGLDYATGDWVVVMDGDLQDQPEAIPELYAKAQEGYDVVFAQRRQRQDTLGKKLASLAFACVYNVLSDVKLDPSCANFSIVTRQVIEQYRRLREPNRAYGLIIRWLGFRIGYQPVQHAARYAGETSYTLARAIRLAVDSITSQSSKPLRLWINIGFAMCLFSALVGIGLVIRALFFKIAVSGWASLMVSIYFLAGLLFANLGMIGLYLGKVFEQTKHRPLYIIRETRNVATDAAPEQTP